MEDENNEGIERKRSSNLRLDEKMRARPPLGQPSEMSWMRGRQGGQKTPLKNVKKGIRKEDRRKRNEILIIHLSP